MLDRLKEYKELIAVMIFFLGGVWWIQDKFPTKSDLKAQISVLECLLGEYMTLTQLQIGHQQLEREIERLNRQINLFQPAGGSGGPALSPAMKQEMSDLVKNRADAQDNLKRVHSEMESINEKLKTHACRKVK